MQDEGISPDSVTLASILKACSSMRAIERGEEIHMELIMDRFPSETTNIVLGTALVDMYAKCGKLSKAQDVFDSLPVRDAVSWTALIDGYAQHGLFGAHALICSGKMQDEGTAPNAITFASMLKACGCIGSLQKGEQIHAQVSIQGLVEKDIVLGNALVDMYAKCGALVKAQEVFDTLPVRDTIAWTALITGYARYGFSAIALSCVDKMRHMEGRYPDALTLISILEASGNTGSSARVGSNLRKLGRSGDGISGVSRYAQMEEAKELVDELKIESDCHVGAQEVKGVFSSFTRMAAEGIRPDSVTFIVLLIACSHAGLVEEGKLYFDLMTDVYGLAPSLEHYTCMVDLLGRAGHLESAVRLIENVAPRHRSRLWPILLGSCRKWENSKLGRWVFEHSVKLNGDDASSYVCMSNIYTTCVK
jgi:hypothetical protein